MEYRKVMDIIAYYLLEFDRRALMSSVLKHRPTDFAKWLRSSGKKEAIYVVFGMNMMS